MKSGKILRAMTRDGSARAIVADTTGIAERARRLHGLSLMSTIVLGRALTGASMIGSLLSEKQESITLCIGGQGEAGKILVVSDYYGNVRGYLEEPQLPLKLTQDGRPDVAGAIGGGYLSLAHETGKGKPQTGAVPLRSGEIAEDIAAYYAESEQIPTVCSLGILPAEDGSVRAAGGVLVQLLPFPNEETVSDLEKNAASFGHVTEMLAKGKSLTEIMQLVMGDLPFDLFDEITTDYLCTCSRERMLRGIRSLGDTQIRELLSEEEKAGNGRTLTAHCRFCETDYRFYEAELLTPSEN